MGVTPAALRSTLDDYLLAQLGPASATDPPWQRSRWAFPSFPPKDTDDVLPRCFAVGVLPGGTFDREVGRQNRAVGANATTQLGVRFTYRLRADRHVGDYGDALTAESVLLQTALESLSASPAISAIRAVGIPERTTIGADAWFLGSITLEVRHFYPLA